jgi:hypothetical protein
MGPEIAKTQEEWRRMEQQLASLTSVTFDTDLYGGNGREEWAREVRHGPWDTFGGSGLRDRVVTVNLSLNARSDQSAPSL